MFVIIFPLEYRRLFYLSIDNLHVNITTNNPNLLIRDTISANGLQITQDTNHLTCMIDLNYIDKNIFKYLNIDCINKMKTYYLCVNVLNKQYNTKILNKYLACDIFIDAFKNDIIMLFK